MFINEALKNSHAFSWRISFSSFCGNLFHMIKTFVCSVWIPNMAPAIWYRLWPLSDHLFAVSPGGRGTNGNPVIIFPEFPAFGELQEDEIQNVLGYLSSVPRYLHPSIKKTNTTKNQNLIYEIKNGPSINWTFENRSLFSRSLYCQARYSWIFFITVVKIVPSSEMVTMPFSPCLK